MTPAPDGIEALPNGQWVVAGDTHLGKWAKEKGTIVTDPNVFRFLHPHVKDAGVVWDVGANIGDHTRQYLDWGLKVVAVEPNPAAFQCLEHNCPESTNLNLAASSTFEHLRFTRLDNVGASRVHGKGETGVPGYPLDTLGLPAPGFVKIDVEGWEPNAIAGMENTLRQHKPVVYVEMNRGALEANGFSPESLHTLIASFGYTREIPYPKAATFAWPQFDMLYLP